MKKVIDKLHLELFESLKVGLAINDMDGNLIYVNEAYAKLIGYQVDEIYKLSYWDITPQKYSEQEQVQLKSLEKSQAYGPYDKEYIHKNGSLIPVRLNGKIIEIDGNKYIWSSIEDITFSKSKEVSTNLEQSAELIDKSVNEIFIFDYSSLIFRYANETALKNIGYTIEEFTGMTPLDIKPEFKEKEFRKLLVPLINDKIEKLEFQTIHKRKDGSTYTSEIKLQKGNYKGKSSFIAFISDITEKKNIERKKDELFDELEKSLQFQKVMQNNAAYALIATTTEGIITSFNKAAENLLGYKAEELINKETLAIFHDLNEVVERSHEFSKIINQEVKPGFETFVCLTEAGMQNEKEWTYITKKGNRVPVLLSITALKNKKNETTGYLGIASDITDRKLKEEELQKAKQNAIDALEVKSSFLANMSHEIRTPMNGILGMTSLLLEEVSNKSSVSRLKDIQTSSQSLLSIINDILDISKIESGKIEIETSTFELNELVKSTIAIHEAATFNKDVKISFSLDKNLPKIIAADELRVKQVINNILSNAVKFTEKGNISLELSAASCEKLGLHMQCSVTDSGIGIDSANHDKIFSSFTQADNSTTRLFGGTGLGLSISRSLVEAMGGTIWVESKLGLGSTFIFKIPIKESLTQKRSHKEASLITNNELPLDILVVEDGLINQKVICSFLKKLNYAPIIANNGQEALERLKKEKIDLIFMDCHMPILDGFKATQEIIRKYKKDRPYIVAVTASAMKEDIQKCYDSGMDYFISKPISIESLSSAFLKYKEKLKSS